MPWSVVLLCVAGGGLGSLGTGQPSLLPLHQLPLPSSSLQEGAWSPALPLGADLSLEKLGILDSLQQWQRGSGLVEY